MDSSYQYSMTIDLQIVRNVPYEYEMLVIEKLSFRYVRAPCTIFSVFLEV